MDERLTAAQSGNAASYFIDRHLVEGRGGKIALIDDRGGHTYFDLAARVDQAGRVLRASGLLPADRIVLCVLDGLDFPALFFGALKIGAVPVPISTYLAPADYDYILRDSGAAAVALSAALLDRIEPILRDQPFLNTVILSAGTPEQIGREAMSPRRVLLDAALSEPNLEDVAARVDDAGFWLYSSGSTGRPKGVLHRQGDLVHTAMLYGEQVLGIREDDVVFSASKMFFAYGLGNSCSFPLHAGATSVVMAERATPEAVIRRMEACRPTIFFAVPTLFASIISHCGPDPRVLSPRLRACVSAGESLPPAVAEKWANTFGVEILDGLGSTESMHIFLSNRPGMIRRASSGKPLPGYEVSLRTEGGAEVGTGETGDLWVRGPSIATGYWNNPEATRRAFVDGWLATGDKYSRDADGFYYYVGRRDDMLKVGGIWVSPIEVETALMDHPEVLEAAVVGERDTDLLIKPKAYVVLRDQALASPDLVEALKQFVKDRLAHYKHPRWIEFRAELPRTATGKLRRGALRARD